MANIRNGRAHVPVQGSADVLINDDDDELAEATTSMQLAVRVSLTSSSNSTV